MVYSRAGILKYSSLPVAGGRCITVFSPPPPPPNPLPVAVSSITFLSAQQLATPGTITRAQLEKKEKRTEAEAERKTMLQRKIHAQNRQLQPESDNGRSKERRRVYKASLELAMLCSLQAVGGRDCRRRYKPFNESDMHRLWKQGVPDRWKLATSPLNR